MQVRKERDRSQKLYDSQLNDKEALENTLKAIKCQHTQLSEEYRLALERANKADARVVQLQEVRGFRNYLVTF